MKNPEGIERTGTNGTNGIPGEANATTAGLRRASDHDFSPVSAFVSAAQPGGELKRSSAEMPVEADDTSSKLATLDGHVQARLGQRLRAMFDEVAREPVPERFLDLLDVLDQQEKRR